MNITIKPLLRQVSTIRALVAVILGLLCGALVVSSFEADGPGSATAILASAVLVLALLVTTTSLVDSDHGGSKEHLASEASRDDRARMRRRLAEQPQIVDIDPLRMRRALASSLQFARPHQSTTVDSRLTASEVALLDSESVTASGGEPGADVLLALTAATATTLLATALTVRAAADHLRTSEDDVLDRLRTRSLYGVYGADGLLLPAFQFTPDGLVPGLDRVLQAAHPDMHLVELWAWITGSDPDLDSGGEAQSPREWLLSGGDNARVVELAAFV